MSLRLSVRWTSYPGAQVHRHSIRQTLPVLSRVFDSIKGSKGHYDGVHRGWGAPLCKLRINPLWGFFDDDNVLIFRSLPLYLLLHRGSLRGDEGPNDGGTRRRGRRCARRTSKEGGHRWRRRRETTDLRERSESYLVRTWWKFVVEELFRKR